jgi:hypothetical protein
MAWPVHVAQGPWRGHACIRLGRNTWYFLCFDSMHASARCLSTESHTAPLRLNLTHKIYRRLRMEGKYFQTTHSGLYMNEASSTSTI